MRHQKGFTLIEMVVVLSVMAIVAGTLVPAGMQILENERERVTMDNMDAIAEGVRSYYRDVGQWPPTTGVTAPQKNLRYLYDRTLGGAIPGWRGPYISSNFLSTDAADNTILYDKWRTAYRAVPDTSSNNYILGIQSAGRDKTFQTNTNQMTAQGDDIVRQVYVGDLTIVEQEDVVTNSMKEIANAVRSYYRDIGQWPPTTGVTPPERNLLYLYQNPGITGWNGPYIMSSLLPKTTEDNTVLYDKWRTRYRVTPDTTYPNTVLRIQSAGSDKVHQTSVIHTTAQGDDIIVNVYVSDIQREVTLTEIEAINEALDYYHSQSSYTPKIVPNTTWPNALRYLQNRSLLTGTNGTGPYLTDSWGQQYRLISAGQKVRSNNTQ